MKAINPIGAGDTCGSSMLYAMCQGSSPQEAFAWGLAAARSDLFFSLCGCVGVCLSVPESVSVSVCLCVCAFVRAHLWVMA